MQCGKMPTQYILVNRFLKDPPVPRVGEEMCALFAVCSFVFHQVCRCVQWHILVPSPPACCIMDEGKETEAAGVLAIKKKKKKKEQSCWLLPTVLVLPPSFYKQQLSVSVTREIATGLLSSFFLLPLSMVEAVVWRVCVPMSEARCVFPLSSERVISTW